MVSISTDGEMLRVHLFYVKNGAADTNRDIYGNGLSTEIGKDILSF